MIMSPFLLKLLNIGFDSRMHTISKKEKNTFTNQLNVPFLEEKKRELLGLAGGPVFKNLDFTLT